MTSKTFKANKSKSSRNIGKPAKGDKNIVVRGSALMVVVRQNSVDSIITAKRANTKATGKGKLVNTKADKLLLDAWEKTYENRNKRKG